ncbi:MAG: hypothetical protein M3Q65_05310, partial [Chloroflexota bacterium]|nr:hypothetical protein [Chloroflexota bacterium]
AYPTAAPTPTPSPPPSPTATPRPTPTPTATPTPVAELRGAGQLLYVGRLGARSGIVAANADGSGQRLLAEGSYATLKWAPDGRQFVAAGPASFPDQIDLFRADGRLLRRFPFARVPLVAEWSPDARQVAVGALPAPAGGGTDQPDLVTWLLGEGGAIEVNLGRVTRPWQWSSDRRLAVTVTPDADAEARPGGADRQELWIVAADGRDARKLAEGQLRPLGWSPDGAMLYALGDPRPYHMPWAQQPYFEPAGLLAIDTRTGERRLLLGVDDLVARLPADGPVPPARWFNGAALAPGGDRLMVEILAAPGDGVTTAVAEGWSRYLVVLETSAQGSVRLLRQDRIAPSLAPLAPAWSPDGARLACKVRLGGTSGDMRLLIAGPDGAFEVGSGRGIGPPDWYAGEDADTTPPRWSPDGRWIAFTRGGRLEIAAGASPARAWPLAVGGQSPGWRPASSP